MPDNKFIKVEDTEIVLEKGKERKKNILCVSPDIPSIFPIVKLFKEYNPILISAGEHLDIQENGCICLRKIHDLLDNSIVDERQLLFPLNDNYIFPIFRKKYKAS